MTHRYSAVFPNVLWDQLEQEAKKQGITIMALLIRYAKLGLLVDQSQEDGINVAFHYPNGKEKQLIIM